MLRILALIALLAIASAGAEAASPSAERFYHFRFVEFPRMVRELDQSIRLAEAEVEVWSARVAHYRPFRTFKQYSPTYTAEQNARLHLLSVEQHLDNLYEQRAQLNRYRRAAIRDMKRQQSASATQVSIQ